MHSYFVQEQVQVSFCQRKIQFKLFQFEHKQQIQIFLTIMVSLFPSFQFARPLRSETWKCHRHTSWTWTTTILRHYYSTVRTTLVRTSPDWCWNGYWTANPSTSGSPTKSHTLWRQSRTGSTAISRPLRNPSKGIGRSKLSDPPGTCQANIRAPFRRSSRPTSGRLDSRL